MDNFYLIVDNKSGIEQIAERYRKEHILARDRIRDYVISLGANNAICATGRLRAVRFENNYPVGFKPYLGTDKSNYYAPLHTSKLAEEFDAQRIPYAPDYFNGPIKQVLWHSNFGPLMLVTKNPLTDATGCVESSLEHWRAIRNKPIIEA